MKKFLSHFASRWYFYILIAVVAVLIWTFVIDGATAPAREEKVELFLTCYSLKSELNDLANDNRPEYLRQVKIGAFNENETFYGAYFNSYGSVADIVTLSQKFCDMTQCSKYFQPLDEDYIESRLGDIAFYYYEGKAYGIRIYGKDDKQGMASEYIGYTADNAEPQDYYLFFNKDSMHLGAMKDGSKDDGALEVIEYLMSL